MAEVFQRTPPLVIYTAVSAALLGVVVARALDTYQNFFAAAFALSHSNGSILVMANTAFLLLYLIGRALQSMFFGPLRPVEIERLYQRGGFFVTDFMLAFATFREAFGISSGVMVSVLLFVKCFHWLLSDRIEAMDQLPYPGPKRLEHARLIALFFVLWACDSILLTYSLDAVMQQGIGLVVLFAAEYAILMVNLTQSMLKYMLSVLEIRRAAKYGGAIAPPWEDKPIYGFYIELSTAFIELTIYLTYFTIMSIYHSIPIYAIRDVYVAGSLFITRSVAFIRYKRAMQALDIFDTPTQEELDRKSDKTCIVCREELNAIPPEGAPPANNADPAAPEPDTSNGPPKRLPCGHIFHRNCLRSWFERQLTCPTCRKRVDDKQIRANAEAARGVAGAPGNNQPIDAANPRPPVPGHAQPNNRGGAANGAQPTEVAQGQVREPLRFEGFYLQAGAFVPWVGGPLLARDPTQPNVPHRHPPVPQRSRHSTAPPTQMPAPPTSAPPSVALQSPPVASAASTTPFTWPPTTSTPPASSPQLVEKPPTDEKPKAVEDDDDDDTTSNSSTEVVLSAEERRRTISEAALRRTLNGPYQSLSSRTGGSGTPTVPLTSSVTPLPTPTTAPLLSQSSTAAADASPMRTLTEREKAYGKYFVMPTEAPGIPADGSQLAKPMGFLASRQSIATAPLTGEYNVRQDAPSFVPLFHSFHLPHYSATVGPSRPWPLQKPGAVTQTLTLPGQATPQPNVHVSTPLQVHGNTLNTLRTSPYPLRVMPQSPSSLQLQHHHAIGNMQPRPESLLSRGSFKRESSPSQELTTQQLDAITRAQVEERLRVLENVKRMTQQCIDELMVVRGAMPNLEVIRPRTEEPRPTIQPQSVLVADMTSSTPIRPASTSTLLPVDPVKPIVEPEIILAAAAPATAPLVSEEPTPSVSMESLSFPAAESASVATQIKQEEVLTQLEPGIASAEGTEAAMPRIEDDNEGVH